MPRSKNSRLKKSHADVEYTQQQIIELQRCIADPVYFMKNYVYIKHSVLGQILFSLFDYQEVMIKNFLENRFCINLLPRQVGKTEVISAYILWFAMYHPTKTIVIASNKGDSAMEIISKIQNAYEELPHWLKIGIDENSWNKHECLFDNKSRIVSFATAEDTGRGLAVSLLYCDEFAFVKDHIQEAFWTSIYPTLSTGGSCIISSTPNGDINKFAQLWREAECGKSSFKPFTVKWNARPGRDEKFKQDAIADLGIIKWKQEYECQFISADHTLIDYETIVAAENKLLSFSSAFELTNPDGTKQEFYKRINRDSTYLVGVDPGTGSGADFTVVEVVEFPSMEQVMEYRTNSVSHPDIYNYIKRILKFLEHFGKEVYWSVESNGVGQGIIALYEADDRRAEKATLISDAGKNVTGMFTTDKTKMEACMILKSMFEKKLLTFYSTTILKELKSYKRAKGAYEAKTGATDDCISATLIVLRMLREISTYDDRAYHKLYTINLNNNGNEWVEEVYAETEEVYNENEVPMHISLL
jgi:hypothetical protein